MKLLDHELITQKSRDLFTRSPNSTKIMNYFCIGNPVDWVHGWWTTTESHGLLWTDSDAERRASGHDGALTGVEPSATPGHGSSPAGAENGERSTGVPFRASLGLGQWCGSWVMAMKQRQRRSSVVVALKPWERGKREGVGAVRTSGGISLL
jgi:hypothetical protein